MTSPASAASSASIPVGARLAHEIPKPKEWQAFQRNCTLLFRAELGDPNAQEYGRSGQYQGGIDILGKRNGNPEHYVGIQCRLIAEPLREDKILADCRAALGLEARLKEMIFATSAPDDTGATNAAIAVERTLRAEGYKLTVVVHGWASLQSLIAVQPVAYAAFCPWVVATSAPQAAAPTPAYGGDLGAQVANIVVAQLRQSGLVAPPREVGAPDWSDEDPPLHARIDTYRDLFRDRNQPLVASQGLLDLLEKVPLDGKPWARFRIETNLASIACDLGREDEAAARFEAAHAIRPDDPQAIANLALARTIQGRFDEAMDLAGRALKATPRADYAVGYLVQAAGRSSWAGDPTTLIPADLVGSAHADLGLAEFLRRRQVPEWAERCLELSRRHPDVPELKRAGAIAILSIALEAGAIVAGVRGPFSIEEFNRAADDMRAFAEHCLDVGFADQHDLVAYLNNTALLLRFAGRHAECETLLKRGLPVAANDPQLRRLLALAQAALERRADALATLADDKDVENQLLAADLSAPDDPRAALGRALAIDPTPLNHHLGQLRLGLIGELALVVGDAESLNQAMAGLRALDPNDVSADLLEVRAAHKAGLQQSAVHERLRAIAHTVPANAPMQTSYLLAEALRNEGLPGEAASLLAERIDLSRAGPATTLYLQSLAAARQDEAFRKALAAAAPAVRDDPEMLWTAAAHAWNVGDLESAGASVEALLRQESTNTRARLLKIEILLRRNRSAELLAELDQRLEDLPWPRLQDRFRIALLLGHFGYIERAAAFAYRLFLENRDKPRAWMTLSTLVLLEGMGDAERAHLWDAPVAAPDIAIDLRYDDGEDLFLVVEPDASLRKLDDDAWEPDHALVVALTGLSQGARFKDPRRGREGTITQLRHKYVARLHYVLQRYEARFPETGGFRGVRVDPAQPGGLDELIAELKSKHDWTEQEQEQYRNGPWPIATLAHRVGLDTIEVALGLAAQGIPLKVAMGNEPERAAATEAISNNARTGCVLDLLAFWIAWRLQAMDAIVATCGTIHVTQSVLDRLHARRERLDLSARDGMRTARYDNGQVAIQEVAPEVIRSWRDDVDRMIAWATVHATIVPLLAGEQLPLELREHLRTGHSDVLDALVAAIQAQTLLVTDDLPTRVMSQRFGRCGSSWLHEVFRMAVHHHHIDWDTFIRWSADLAAAGHNYLSVTGTAMTRSVQLDAWAGEVPGYLFRMLSKSIGGSQAEPLSHVVVCSEFLRTLWADPDAANYRARTTGHLLSQLLRGRSDDYLNMLKRLLYDVRDLPWLVEYIHSWARGHFTPVFPTSE